MIKKISEQLSQEERTALYELVFAVASADSHITTDEINAIISNFDINSLDDDHKARVREFIQHPSNIDEIIKVFCDSDELIRYSIIYFLCEVIVADEVIEAEENEILIKVCKGLSIGDIQRLLIMNYIFRKKRLTSLHKDIEKIRLALEDSKEALEYAHIPLIEGFVI